MYIAQLNRYRYILFFACDKDFRMIERLLSAELEGIRFMSDWNLYYTFRRAKLIQDMSRGNSQSDELGLSSVLGDTRAHLCSPVLG